MNRKKLISIVIPVYNAEVYLKQCVDSIIGQDFGFEKIELILVNDGSRDSSENICLEYANKYPDNVVYYKQKNSGSSVARNKGIELANCELTGFVDSDDVLSKNACSSVYRYFQTVHNYVDVAVIPVKNFGARKDQHNLNGKFADGTRTIILDDPQWYDVCTRVAQAFFRTEVLKRHKFDHNLTLFEDTKFINDILLEKMRLGVVTGATYFYRRYPGECDSSTSLTVGATKNKSLYLETPKRVSLYFLSLNSEEESPLHLQYLALAEMRWRTFYNDVLASDFLNADEYVEYVRLNEQILSRISDEAILSCGLYNFWQKIYLLNMKYNEDILTCARYDDDATLIWKNHKIFNLPEEVQLNLTDILVNKDTVIIQGYILGIVTNQICLYLNVNGDLVESVIEKDAMDATIFPLEHKAYRHSTFSATIPLKRELEKISFTLKVNGQEFKLPKIGISKKGNGNHVVPILQIRDGHIINRTKDNIIIRKNKIKYLLPVYDDKLKNKSKHIYKKVRGKLSCILMTKTHK